MSDPDLAVAATTATKPKLVFFYSPQSGRCRRVEGFIAQVLQRRRNHETFELVRVSVDKRPDLADRFGVETVPTISWWSSGSSAGGSPRPAAAASSSASSRPGCTEGLAPPGAGRAARWTGRRFCARRSI
jgi:hypothetical protein